LSDAIIVIPEGTLAFGAVIGHVETLWADWVAILAGDKIVEEEGSAGATGDTASVEEVLVAQAAFERTARVFRNINVPVHTIWTIGAVAGTAAIGTGLAGIRGGIAEESDRAGVLTGACAVESKVWGWAYFNAGKWGTVFIVVDREGGAVSETLAFEQIQIVLAAGTVLAI
jgi:hypothetical protein